ncbi:MAG: hypothetical protein ISS66_12755 [Desulfobacteraceae bacterium]|nr:hypothetical protein [Desulfobacteraceae bacterium]
MIDTFSFGSIVIDGKKYMSDLVIFPNGNVVDSWRRKSGHRLSGDDIRTLIESEPDVIIAGTGVNGLVIPDKELEKILSQTGIDFIYAPNQKAIELYNDLITKKSVGACFHLTC